MKRVARNLIRAMFKPTLSMRQKAKTGIVMMNMGGPATLDKVEGFLTNLFCDPDIIPLGKLQPQIGPFIAKRRTPSITKQYKDIGGGSPIAKLTEQQGQAMCKILDQKRPEVCCSKQKQDVRNKFMKHYPIECSA